MFNRSSGSETGRAAAWLKLIAGACLLLLIAAVFASGYTPPGMAGEVIRHNQKEDIDASPFFYGDVDNMLELIEGAERWWHNGSIENDREITTPLETGNQED
jgi:hypothetical protein